jgi:hypothetical protein
MESRLSIGMCCKEEGDSGFLCRPAGLARLINNANPGLTSWATIVSPCGLVPGMTTIEYDCSPYGLVRVHNGNESLQGRRLIRKSPPD